MDFLTTQIGFNNSSNHLEYFADAHDLFFENSELGYVIGNTNKGGTIFKTSNAGISFTPYLINSTSKIFKVLNINDSLAFLGGEDGLLVKWDKTIPLTDVLQTEEFQEIDNQIHVYPNPAQDFVTVEFPEMHKINTITLTDLAGTKIQKFDTFNNTMTIDLSKFPSGIYLIYIYTKDREIVRRIIKTPN